MLTSVSSAVRDSLGLYQEVGAIHLADFTAIPDNNRAIAYELNLNNIKAHTVKVTVYSPKGFSFIDEIEI